MNKKSVPFFVVIGFLIVMAVVASSFKATTNTIVDFGYAKCIWSDQNTLTDQICKVPFYDTSEQGCDLAKPWTCSVYCDNDDIVECKTEECGGKTCGGCAYNPNGDDFCANSTGKVETPSCSSDVEYCCLDGKDCDNHIARSNGDVFRCVNDQWLLSEDCGAGSCSEYGQTAQCNPEKLYFCPGVTNCYSSTKNNGKCSTTRSECEKSIPFYCIKDETITCRRGTGIDCEAGERKIQGTDINEKWCATYHETNGHEGNDGSKSCQSCIDWSKNIFRKEEDQCRAVSTIALTWYNPISWITNSLNALNLSDPTSQKAVCPVYYGVILLLIIVAMIILLGFTVIVLNIKKIINLILSNFFGGGK